MTQSQIQELKKKYAPGTKIVMVKMGDDPHPVKPGTKGRVQSVDDIGTIHVVWTDGRVLGIVPGVDDFRIITDREQER